MAFDIVAGDFEGKKMALSLSGTLKINDGTFFSPKVEFPLSDILSVELVEGDKIAIGKGMGFAAAGFLVGGPLGAAVAGGVGALAGRQLFVVELTSGQKMLCKGYRAEYKQIKGIALKNELDRAAAERSKVGRG
jgi:hypothetical protein